VTAKALVAQFRSQGFRLRVDDGALLVAPRAALTEDDRTAIHEHLAELKALLQREADVAMVVAGALPMATTSKGRETGPRPCRAPVEDGRPGHGNARPRFLPMTSRTPVAALAPRPKPCVKRRGAQHGRAR
jgi:hypothetical protein